MSTPPHYQETALASARAVMQHEANAITSVASRLDDSVTGVIQLIENQQGRLVFSGMGKMGYIARKAAATFCSTGSPAIFLHPAEAIHGDLGIVSSDDIFVALSNSGETAEVLNLLPYMKRFDIPIVAITGNSESALARHGDWVIDIHVDSETNQDEVAPTASTAVALSVCDALAIAVARLRGFTKQQFAMFHPGGNLGRKLLLTTQQIMHRRPDIPEVSPKIAIRDAIVEMSRKRLGCVVVVDGKQAVGILTDGDIRRALQKCDNPLEDCIALHMSRAPTTIIVDSLAADAMRLMQQRSITVIPVVDSNQETVGIIHLHDLLRAGIA